MIRRVIAIVLIAASVPPVLFGVRLIAEDWIRGGVIVAVSTVAMLAALPGLLAGKVAVVAWLRWLAVGLCGVVLVTMLALWYFLAQVTVPDLEQRLVQSASSPTADAAEMRGRIEAFRVFAQRLLWLSYAVLICGCSIATLPAARRSMRTSNDRAEGQVPDA